MDKIRKSPSESATNFSERTIKFGNDKQKWVVKKLENGTHRWIPYINAELSGYKLLTVDYIAKHIGKTITIYEREYNDMWPSKSTKMYSATFTPTGDAGIFGKKLVTSWLKIRKPPIKNRTHFIIDGQLKYKGTKDFLNGLQVDSINKNAVSSNIMNIEAFIKI